MAGALEAVQDADIDVDVFKYILIKVTNPKEKQEKYIVRGYRWAGYHGDILDDVEPKITSLGLTCECVGGGRIKHRSQEKEIEIYGYSQGYGRADHNITSEILKKKYPDYKIVITKEEY